MTPTFSPRLLSAARAVARLAAAIVIVGGILVLIGWEFDIEFLKCLGRGFVAMNPVSAVMFSLSGLALAALLNSRGSPTIRRLSKAGALVLGFLGLLKILSYIFPWDLGVDRMLFHDRVLAVGNQIAPNTAFEFLLIGLALALVDVELPRGRRPSQMLALVALTLALFASFGYVYGAHALFGVGHVEFHPPGQPAHVEWISEQAAVRWLEQRGHKPGSLEFPSDLEKFAT